ncbi:cyclopropane-fatty-acyl-phospholipid synthase family protein [Streptacidiphilus sp. EB103A]|uniref:SAM-dependent methyltransferase n=1 Tax=Streptacidiphilus sp. EB103A TaxID=3156275 RepID=UPI0035174E22
MHHAQDRRLPEIQVVDSPRIDPYRDKVVYTYDDPPHMWHKALGEGNLLFQFGLFDAAELARGPTAGSVGPSEVRHFGRQLELAGLVGPSRPQMNRILDLGCGWGFISRYLARRFPECRRIDAVNISERQLGYCAEKVAEEQLGDRIELFLCDGQDVDLLPDPEVPYDLVVVRGVYTHFLNDVFEASVSAVAKRCARGSTVVISDTLYKTDLTSYRPAIEDTADRLACGNRKSPGHFVRALEAHGLVLQDMRIMPSNAEVVHWFQKVRLNIERHFPDGVSGPIEELREMAISFSVTLEQDQASVYSIVTRRAA